MKKNRLHEIEERLLELEEETRGIVPVLSFRSFEIEKAQLEKERQFILDERNSGWKSKIIWSIIAPIIVSIVVGLLIRYF